MMMTSIVSAADINFLLESVDFFYHRCYNIIPLSNTKKRGVVLIKLSSNIGTNRYITVSNIFFIFSFKMACKVSLV